MADSVMSNVTVNSTLGVLNIGTEEKVVDVPWGQIAIYLLIIIIIVLGNSLVIAAVLRYGFLQTPTNVFVMGTAAMDLMMGVLGMFKVGQLVYIYEGYYTCMARLGIGILQAVATGNLLAGTVMKPRIKYLSCSLTGQINIYLRHLKITTDNNRILTGKVSQK